MALILKAIKIGCVAAPFTVYYWISQTIAASKPKEEEHGGH
jgi:hypothetical protein